MTQQQQIEISPEEISKMMGDKDFALLSLQALNRKIVVELNRVSEENKVLTSKLKEITEELRGLKKKPVEEDINANKEHFAAKI